jgi:hypothetical protein
MLAMSTGVLVSLQVAGAGQAEQEERHADGGDVQVGRRVVLDRPVAAESVRDGWAGEPDEQRDDEAERE